MCYKPGQGSSQRVVDTWFDTRRERWAFVGLVAAFLLVAMAAPRSLASTADHVVIIRQMRFNPTHMTVTVGDKVEWKNEDIFSHTVTADDGSFDSGLIAPRASWRSEIAHAGVIGYHCRPHPNMVAQLTVEASGNQQRPANSDDTRHENGSGALGWRVPNKPDELHPILVNFTAALLPMALLSDVLGRIFRRASLHAAGFWLIVYAAAITPFTALAGWWWRTTAASPDHAGMMAVHQWLGSAAAVLFLFVAVWRWQSYKRGLSPTIPYFAFAFLVFIALVYQGSLGGQMAFGH